MKSRPQGMSTRRRISGSGLQLARGFTLVELLIAMALTLMLVYAIARFYSYVGETVRDGRAQIEMGNSLRAAADRLEQDFAELTVRVGGRIDAGAEQGYLEISEGAASDSDPDGDFRVDTDNLSIDLQDANNDLAKDGPMIGDTDDVVSFTIRTQGDAFVGRRFSGLDVNGVPQYIIIQSNTAEIVWFTSFQDANGNNTWEVGEQRYLVRRQLLVRPDLAVSTPNNATNPFHHNDISCRVGLDAMGNPVFVANSLGDLTRRENRMVHQNLANLAANGLNAPSFMPNIQQLVPFVANSVSVYSLDGILQFAGEDKMLSNLMAFDVRLYDPAAVLRADNLDPTGSGTPSPDDAAAGVVAPGDAGYALAAINNFPVMGMGAYVDLWYSRTYQNIPNAQRAQVMLSCNSAYAWAPNPRSGTTGIAAAAGPAIWETLSTSYEKDGIDQFSDMRTDPLVDGLDTDNQNGVDDPNEAEVLPPYPSWVGFNGFDDDGQNGPDDSTEQGWSRPSPQLVYPMATTLRGIEVRIRLYEPGTRQTRQLTVATDFIPE